MSGQIVRCPHCRKAIGVVDGIEQDKRACVRKAARKFKVSGENILSRNRVRRIVKARHYAWILMREKGYTFPEIGDAFGVDHSSIQYAVRNAVWT